MKAPFLFKPFVWFLLLGGLCFPACRPEPGEMTLIDERLTAEAGGTLFSLSDINTVSTVFEWRLKHPDESARWTKKALDARSKPAAGGYRVIPTQGRPALDREVDFEAGQVDRIDVEISGARRGSVRLLWAGRGEPFHPDRSMQLEASKHTRSVFSFDLTRHPAWSGRIQRIRLMPTSLAKQPVIVAGLKGIDYRFDNEKLDALAGRALRLELDHDVRPGILLGLGQTWTRSVEVPVGGNFEFSFGSPIRSTGTRLEVAVHSSSAHEELLAAFGFDDFGRWEQARIDLSPWEGETIELTMRAIGSGDQTDSGSIVFAANPQVTRSARRSELQPNVVLIVLDTLRADRVSANGYHRVTTPKLDRWARDCAVNFPNTIAPSPWTLPSHVSLFTGQDAIVHGSNFDEGALPEFDLLAEQMRRAGYTTRAITGGGYLHPRYGFDQGFDSFRYWPPDRHQRDEIENGTERAISVISDLEDRPFFLFFHTFEVHKPYDRREPYFSEYADGRFEGIREKVYRNPTDEASGFVEGKSFRIVDETGEHALDDETRGFIDALYDSGVRFADLHVGQILERLEVQRGTRDTLVIVTADHGEALGDHDLASHAYLYDFNVRIPLMISLPGAGHDGLQVERQVRLIDVMPTILEVTGLEAPARFDGESLVPLFSDPNAPFPDTAWSYAASTNRGLALRVDNRLKLITNDTIWQAVRGEERLYRLQEDPSEEQNLIGEPVEELEQLRRATMQKWQRAERGLRIDIENHRTSTARISFGPVTPNRPKAMWAPDGTVVDHEKKSMVINVEAGGKVPLRVENPGLDRPLKITSFDQRSEVECTFSVELRSLPDSVRYCASASCCGQEIEGERRDVIHVSLAPIGDTGLDSMGSMKPIDEELRKKLEALGYVQSP